MSDGSRIWLIPDAYMPAAGPPGPYQGHESLCTLSTGTEDASISISDHLDVTQANMAFLSVVGHPGG